jgi:hypothetical protein
MEIADIAGFAADVDALEELGTETRSWYSLALVAEWRAMRSMMIGDFDAAERHITEVVERGGRDSNFLNVWTTQLFFWHRERGSLESISEPTRAAVEANPGLVAFASGLALMEAELGRLDNARALFERFALDGFATVPRDATFTATLSVLIEVCALLGDGDRARELYGLLAPRRGRLLVWVWGIACAGAVDRFLGTLAATYGDVDTAASHYRAALELETASGATALAARTRRLLERLPTG